MKNFTYSIPTKMLFGKGQIKSLTREFFLSLDIPMTLKEAEIGEEDLEDMAKAAIANNGGPIGNFKPLDYEDVLAIFKKSL